MTTYSDILKQMQEHNTSQVKFATNTLMDIIKTLGLNEEFEQEATFSVISYTTGDLDIVASYKAIRIALKLTMLNNGLLDLQYLGSSTNQNLLIEVTNQMSQTKIDASCYFISKSITSKTALSRLVYVISKLNK